MKLVNSLIRTGQEGRFFGRSVKDLKHFKAPKAYNLANVADFESAPSAKAEDHKRWLSLMRALKDMKPGLQKLRATELAKKLSTPDTPETLASYRYFRDLRKGTIPHIWKLLDETPLGQVRFVTILVKGWQYRPEELHRVKPRKLLRRFRSDLYRCGFDKVEGCGFFGLHGEYSVGSGLFDIHIHGVIVGDMELVFAKLRKRPKYRSYQSEQQGVKQRIHRIRISDKPLTNMPAPITYTMQSWWPAKGSYRKDGKILRRRTRQRIPDFPHTLWLLWMDRWDISDLTMMVRMRVSKNKGLYVPEKRTRTDDEIIPLTGLDLELDT